MAVWKVRPSPSALPSPLSLSLALLQRADGCIEQANSRNAALLEEFLLRRAQSSSSSTSATSGAHQLTAAEEEELANQALVAGRIDKRTGEPTASTADLVGAGGTGAVGGEGEGARAAAEASRASGTGAGGGQGGGRKFYGWGKGAEPAAETAAVKR